MKKFVLFFDEITHADVARVGGKNASLGEMVQVLLSKNIRVPYGFAVTADAYWYYLEHNSLLASMRAAMSNLPDVHDAGQLQKVSKELREQILQGVVPEDLKKEIIAAYQTLSKKYDMAAADVAVRSSATAEDLPTASFAGQQETYLNVQGAQALIESYKKCLASLFTDRAIFYRREHGFDDFKIALSAGVQKMVRSDKACSGVAFSLDTETGFKEVVMIEASWGLGETVVKGLVVPDEYMVHKPTLEKGYASVIKKQCGAKREQLVYGKQTSSSDVFENYSEKNKPVVLELVSEEKQNQFCLSDQEILALARDVVEIEKHYSQLHGRWMPMDVEWAKDGVDGTVSIVQARPETVHGIQEADMSAGEHVSQQAVTRRAQQEERGATFVQYRLTPKEPLKKIVSGISIGQKIVSGSVRIVESVEDISQVQKGDVLVTHMTDPDWVPAMKRAAGIVTEQGGRTCHAAIVGRELGATVIVGAAGALQVVKNGQQVTVDCSQGSTGYVYEGQVPFDLEKFEIEKIPQLPMQLMTNLADPGQALTFSRLPVAGVGLARLEFIITNTVRAHPLALVFPERVADAKVRAEIDRLTVAFESKEQFFIDTVAHGIGMIAAAFYPRPVIVRLSDFKSNEYRNLVGGIDFEPKEENPMLGFRGASRYCHERYQDAFALECAAFAKTRDEMGFVNIKLMVPFVRTVAEAETVLAKMAQHGLKRGKNGLEIIMMCEIPSNVILIDEFSKLFDGISIGSNDLAQLTLGVDRDSALLSETFDERDPSVKQMLKLSVEGAVRNKIHSGICGQAPSDFPELADFLIDAGIDSISLNPDAVMPFIMRYQ